MLATLVAEVYGPVGAAYADLIAAAKRVRKTFESTRRGGGRRRHQHRAAATDRVPAGPHEGRAARHLRRGRRADAGRSRSAACSRRAPTSPRSARRWRSTLRLPRAQRSSLPNLLALRVHGADGGLVATGRARHGPRRDVEDQPIYHKNLRAVRHRHRRDGRPQPGRRRARPAGCVRRSTRCRAGYSVDWAGEGEWKITVDVFRDLGLAFGAALLLIYVLLVAQTGSLLMPVVIMLAIPLTMIGIMPGFWLLNLLTDHPVAGYATPVFFTATAMIGMIALAGIVVRNSIILIDFIHLSQARGLSLREAILEAGAVRFRPIFLTAGAAMLGRS